METTDQKPATACDTLYIVMPAYNERDNIDAVVAQWHPVVEKTGGGSRLLVVNDGSRDDTFVKLQALRTLYSRLVPVDRPNSGHGATCIFAYHMAIGAGADYVFQTDSDGQTDPGEFWHFWEQRGEYDFIIGLRAGRQDGFSRKIVTLVLRLLVRIAFGVPVPDANTPFRLMHASRLQTVLEVVPTDVFLSNAIISAIAVKWRERCKWCPITFKPRQGGKNFVNLRRIFKIGWRAVRDFHRINRKL
jgi:glycosyltransferase involved in cell wall biosynthesis